MNQLDKLPTRVRRDPADFVLEQMEAGRTEADALAGLSCREILQYYGFGAGLVWLLFVDNGKRRVPWMTAPLDLAIIGILTVILLHT